MAARRQVRFVTSYGLAVDHFQQNEVDCMEAGSGAAAMLTR